MSSSGRPFGARVVVAGILVLAAGWCFVAWAGTNHPPPPNSRAAPGDDIRWTVFGSLGPAVVGELHQEGGKSPPPDSNRVQQPRRFSLGLGFPISGIGARALAVGRAEPFVADVPTGEPVVAPTPALVDPSTIDETAASAGGSAAERPPDRKPTSRALERLASALTTCLTESPGLLALTEALAKVLWVAEVSADPSRAGAVRARLAGETCTLELTLRANAAAVNRRRRFSLSAALPVELFPDAVGASLAGPGTLALTLLPDHPEPERRLGLQVVFPIRSDALTPAGRVVCGFTLGPTEAGPVRLVPFVARVSETRRGPSPAAIAAPDPGRAVPAELPELTALVDAAEEVLRRAAAIGGGSGPAVVVIPEKGSPSHRPGPGDETAAFRNEEPEKAPGR